MKKIMIVVAMMFATSVTFAQRIAHVDTEYILNKIPAYTEAQQKLDNMSKSWQTEVEASFAKVDEMYKKFQAESDLLPQATKTEKENEIVVKEKEAKELQKKYFGAKGELAKSAVAIGCNAKDALNLRAISASEAKSRLT